MDGGAIPVVFDGGGQPEIVDYGKYGLLWNNLEELQQKTSELIKNKELREKMSKEAINRSRIYSKDSSKTNIEKIIKEIVNL